MAKVFQYGSNCDTERLNSRCRLRGKACSLGKAQTVCNFEIAFDVWSYCNDCAAADLIQRGDTPAWGVLYEIPADGLKTLEGIEGPNYESRYIEVVAGGGKPPRQSLSSSRRVPASMASRLLRNTWVTSSRACVVTLSRKST